MQAFKSPYIHFFEDVSLQDIAHVGGKNASLGEMIQTLKSQNIPVPSGFIITVKAYWHFVESNNLLPQLTKLLKQLDVDDIENLQKTGLDIRSLFMSQSVPQDLADEVIKAYQINEERYGANWSAAMRSSATAEDLPNASFAGQQETLLNITSSKDVVKHMPRLFASLFTDRALSYRTHHNFDHLKVGLSIGVQKMIRSDLASSGVIFTLDTDTGFSDVVYITGSYGLGEYVVQGIVNPDEYYVHKPTRAQGFKSLLKKRLGSKEQKLLFAQKSSEKTVEDAPVPHEDQIHFALTDDEVLQLADYAIAIESHYSKLYNKPTPMDIEWAKDGTDQKLYIVQARPETVYGQKKDAKNFIKKNMFFVTQPPQSACLVTGSSIGEAIVSGIARHITSAQEINKLKPGEILITNLTDPDWEPLMKKAAGIVTNQGGRTCHAAIVSRELNIPAIVGTINGTEKIKDGQEITLDCSRSSVGYIYEGTYETKTTEETIAYASEPIPLWINVGNPDEAFASAHLPYQGIGLARLEFIINTSIKAHPMALIHPEKTDSDIQKQLKQLTCNYQTPQEYFIKTLAQEIGTIAAAAYPRPTIVRFSDFKSNEYKNLLGGSFFEPDEENPMLGFRGASRYYDEKYQEAFELECKAFLHARQNLGFTNIQGLVPFVRTLDEAKKVTALIEKFGLKRSDNFHLLMMCELPANVLLLEKFSDYFDGFSIGSNDLTQLTLGLDRDSALIAHLFDEQNEAITIFLKIAIEKAKKANKKIGICGQAPESHPELAKQLIAWGIDTVSCTSRGFLILYQALQEKKS